MQRNLFILTLFVVFASTPSLAQLASKSDPYFGETCTSIMVGKKASADGSVMTAHTCDGNYRTWMRIEKATDNADTAKTSIYKGLLHTETPWDMRNVNTAGRIPQAKHTYAFLNTGYPCMNEKQLAIGEATITGHDTLVNEKGMFLIEELERIVLQRCTTARDAIRLIDQLTKQYGYGDWGECITIADKKEVWQFEIFGAGKNKLGAVWAAQRIPDDHVGISANISRIGKIDLKNKDYFMASDNVFSVAKDFGLWDGKSDFKFWKAYGATKKPYTIREYWVFKQLDPSLKITMDMDELPFSIKPAQKVTLEKMTELYRSDYANSAYDMTQNFKYIKKKYDKQRNVIGQDTLLAPMAQPWMSRDLIAALNYLKPNTVEFVRTVSVAWCSYSHITQLRDWLPDEVGGVCWMSFDNPGESPRIPIFSGNSKVPDKFEVCGQKNYREDAAIWDYRKANKLATVAWQKTKNTMLESVLSFEEKAKQEAPMVESKVIELTKAGKKEDAQKYLNNYTQNFYGATVTHWKNLENNFWTMFRMGF